VLDFHHLGIACVDISISELIYNDLGYIAEGAAFVDEKIGIRGLFMTKSGAPRIELVEDIGASRLLETWLTSGSPMYHIAFMTDVPFERFTRSKGELLVFGPTYAQAFENSEVWFTIRDNRQLVEYINVVR
jgi:methylmalonyl-CoA/ethylmalonyl-CoA epimerase